MAGVGLNAKGFDQAGPRVGRLLDVPGDEAAAVMDGAGAQGGAMVKPFDVPGLPLLDAGAGIEVKALLLLVHQEIEEDLAIQEFEHFPA